MEEFMEQAKDEIRNEYHMAFDIFDTLFNNCETEFDKKVLHFASCVMQTHGAILGKLEEVF